VVLTDTLKEKLEFILIPLSTIILGLSSCIYRSLG